ncbi:hypothetical protein PTKIN_Ptkin14bG0087500 [Pterospermum kingtungense]
MNLFLYIASVLDPTKKFGYVTFCFNEMYEKETASAMVSNVKKAMEELFHE